MRLIVVGDIHLAVNPPGRRAEGYLEELFAMLDEIIAKANELDASVALIGDLFHHKRWSRVPHWLVDMLMMKLAQIKRTVIVLPGNHDLADGSMESFSRQPIALLRFLPNVRFAGMGVMVYVEHDVKDSGIYVAGIPGIAAVTEARPETLPLYGERCDVLLVHGPISDRVMPWPTWQPDQLGLDCQVMLYGHQHDAARVVRNVHPIVIATGSIARGAIHEADHTPSYVVLTFTDGGNDGSRPALANVQIEELRAARPAAEIYRWAERTAEKAHDDAMTTFVTSLSSSSLVGFSRESLIQTIVQRVELPMSVRHMAVEILEGVAT